MAPGAGIIRQADGINQVHCLTPEEIGAIQSQAGEVGSSWRGCGTNLRNVFIFLRRVTAHANGADHLSIDDNWDSALKWSSPRQSERGDSALAYLVLKDLARSAKDSGGSSLSDLGVVEVPENDHMATAII